MKLQIDNAVGKVQAGQVKEYKKNPGSINLAAQAGAYYAKKQNERVVIIEGNSYMNRIYHIAKESDSLSKFTATSSKARVLVIEPTGECFYATAE